MIVSLTRQFIFVHIPKNAGTSIQSALERYRAKFLTRGRGKHEALESFHLRTFGLMRRFRSFAVVRNPWDRTFSGYRYLLTRPGRAGIPDRIQSFDDYVADLEVSPEWMRPIRTVRPQLTFITDATGRLITSRLVRYETLETDFARLCNDWRLSGELPHKNKGTYQGSCYRDQYSARSREIVGRVYAQDILQFGYEF